MNTTSVLRAEAKRLRELADRIDRFADEIGGAGENVSIPNSTAQLGGEFAELSQTDAILAALKKYGPQTTGELFERLNRSGQNFKKRTYVTALLARIRDKIDRLDTGKIQLKGEAKDF